MLSNAGMGMTLPLTLIYLHEVRGIALPVVGLLLAAAALATLAMAPMSGIVLDHVGPRRVVLVAVTGSAAAQAGLAWAHSAVTALPAMVVWGAAIGVTYPGFMMLFARLNPEPVTQQRAFAADFMAANVGLGTGTAIGAAVADLAHPGSFQALFLTCAFLRLLLAAVVCRLPDVQAVREPRQRKAGYREVLASRPLRAVLLASLALSFTGYAAMDSGLPAYASVEGHISVHIIALSITVNTALIVAAQMLVLRRIKTIRRSSALAAVGLIWAAAWAIFGLCALRFPTPLRTACVLSFTAIFAAGEMVLTPTLSPLVNVLVGEQVRGRANALMSGTYSLALVLSPAICTGLIAAGLSAAWIGLLCLGCLSTVPLAARLGRSLSPEQDHLTEAAIVSEETPA